MEMTKVGRDPLFDNVKILLILLVVLAHVLPIDFKDRINLTVSNFIVTFTMPLFIFVSGYFTKVTNWESLKWGIIKLFETLMVFTIIHLFILYLQGKHIGIDTIVCPCWTLWYMVCLIWWRIMLYFLPNKIRDNNRTLITIGILMCLIMGFVPLGTEFSFQRTFSFFPFFLMGYVARKENMINRLRINTRLAVTVLVLVFLGLYIANSQMRDYFHLNWNYYHYNSIMISLCIRAGLLIFSTLMSICFFSVIPRKEYKWTHFGQITLFIYMWHSVILIWRFILRDAYALPTSFPYCVLYAMLVVAVIYLMSKVKVFHWLLNPITNTLNRKQ